MELTVTVKALVEELQLADGIVGKEKEGADLVHLATVEDSLKFNSRGTSLGLETSCPVQVISGGAITVPMRRLLAYLQLLPADAELRIATSKADMAEITLVRAKTRIPALAAAESFNVELAGDSAAAGSEPMPFPDSQLELPASLILDALKHAMVSVADEQSHYTIEGAQIVVRHDKAGMVSTDGHRLSLYLQQASPGVLHEDIECLIGRKAMIELRQMLECSESPKDEPLMVQFAVDDSHIYFRTERRFLRCQKLSGRFPDYSRVLPSDFNVTLELDKDVLEPVLRRLSVLSERSAQGVRIDITEGLMKMQAQVVVDHRDTLQSEESIPIDYVGDPIQIGFNIRYVLEFLQICPGSKFRLQIGDPRSAAQMEIPGTDPGTDYRYVVMPIRV
ncbi:MAG: DNA polymerase III subunit beta [Bryobacterales bacterium]|nr:DNA polymerase III subunit beta [Bryobacterales bacterium]